LDTYYCKYITVYSAQKWIKVGFLSIDILSNNRGRKLSSVDKKLTPAEIEQLLIEARAAGLDLKTLCILDNVLCVLSADVVALINWRNPGHTIDSRYINNRVRPGELHPIRPSAAKQNFYRVDEVLLVIVKDQFRPRGYIMSDDSKRRAGEKHRANWAARKKRMQEPD
jgi:hypothetical protein